MLTPEILSPAIVIFREMFEIVLIVGIVLAATRGLPGRGKWIALGFGAGVAGSALIAVFAEAISNAADGLGQEIFNAGVLAIAALFIGWTVIWMSTHAREMVAHIKDTGRRVVEGEAPCYVISIVIGLAILREGAEIVLFTYGMLSSGKAVADIAMGSVIGFVGGTTLGLAIYWGLISIPSKYVFRVTSWLLILLVAGLAAQSVGYLSQAGYFESLSNTVWDSSHILDESSVFGQIMHALAGYTSQPTQAQLIVYVFAIGVMVSSLIVLSRRQNAATAKA